MTLDANAPALAGLIDALRQLNLKPGDVYTTEMDGRPLIVRCLDEVVAPDVVVDASRAPAPTPAAPPPGG